jgi:hypothetical protein
MKVQQLHVGAGTALGPLTIFPVWTGGAGELGISTGTHADVAVTELASGPQVRPAHRHQQRPAPGPAARRRAARGRPAAPDLRPGRRPRPRRDPRHRHLLRGGRPLGRHLQPPPPGPPRPAERPGRTRHRSGRPARRRPAGPHLEPGQPLRRRPGPVRDQLPARAHGPVHRRAAGGRTASVPPTPRLRSRASAAW